MIMMAVFPSLKTQKVNINKLNDKLNNSEVITLERERDLDELVQTRDCHHIPSLNFESKIHMRLQLT